MSNKSGEEVASGSGQLSASPTAAAAAMVDRGRGDHAVPDLRATLLTTGHTGRRGFMPIPTSRLGFDTALIAQAWKINKAVVVAALVKRRRVGDASEESPGDAGEPVVAAPERASCSIRAS